MAVLSRRAIEQEERYGVLRPVSLDKLKIDRRFYLIWRRMRELSPVAEQFRRHLLGFAGKAE